MKGEEIPPSFFDSLSFELYTQRIILTGRYMAKKLKKSESTKTTTNNFKEILGLIDNQYASVAEDGTSADVASYIDTGSYVLNALYSGSLFGGLPGNKIIAIAGDMATGKTFFALSILKHFLNSKEDGLAIIFESEGSITKNILTERSIDTSRVLVVPVETVQQFKIQAIKIVENYLKQPVEERRPLFFMLDSLGNLSTTKEMTDSEQGKETKDMTRAQEIKGAFRVLTLKCSKSNIPLIVTNHTYQGMGMFATKEMSGGSGLEYCSNFITFLSKAKDKDAEGKILGSIITCTNKKNRLTREGIKVKTLISYTSGLDRYYGLVDLAIECGVWKKLGTKVVLTDGSSEFQSRIEDAPEKFFTDDVLKALDVGVGEKFRYGGAVIEEVVAE